MLARVSRTFGIGPMELLDYSIKVFWFMNRQVDRLQAEDDLRQLHLLGAATNQEGYSKAIEQFRKTMGEIVVFGPSEKTLEILIDPEVPDPSFERDKLHALKDLM